MLTQSLTYLQVMPEFLDLLFPLGERVVAQDFYSCGFQQQTRLSKNARGMQVPERAWSGYHYQFCYSLKSVERSEIQHDWPWSIRHCAVHHLFDVVNVRSTWVVVKGDRLMERRIASATSGRSSREFSSYGTVDKAFAATLATHLIMVDWSVENWRWYISFLEDKFETLTKDVISIDADVLTNPIDTEDIPAIRTRTNTQITNRSHKSLIPSPTLFRFPTQRTNTTPSSTEMSPLQAQHFHKNERTGKKQPLPPGKTIVSPEATKLKDISYDTYGQRKFKFRHLQDIHDLEEKANETKLVLKLNLNICKQISEFYRSLFDNREIPNIIEENCEGDLIRFERRIKNIECQTNAQVLRVKALLRLIADRKTLVSLNTLVMEPQLVG